MPLSTADHAAIKRIAAFVLSAGLGALLLTAHPVAIALTGAVPTIWLTQPSRLGAYATACVYYAAATWPVIPIMHGFNGSWLLGILTWAGGLVVLALPWLAFHSTRPVQRIACGGLATLASVVPPLGLIGVGCLLSSAGLLFPGCKIVGLLAASMLPGFLAWNPRLALLLAIATILLANVRYTADPPRKIGWEGVDIIADSTPGAFGDFQRINAMLAHAESSSAQMIVFPEAAIRSWTPTTLAFFDDRIRSLSKKGKTILTGALIPTRDGYRNVVEALGSITTVFEQRVPVPFGMWLPFSGRGVHLSLLGSSVLPIAGARTAILLCYEQLIPWPEVVATVHDPTVVVGVGNDVSVQGTPVPPIKITILHSWSRLWRAPLVTACRAVSTQ